MNLRLEDGVSLKLISRCWGMFPPRKYCVKQLVAREDTAGFTGVLLRPAFMIFVGEKDENKLEITSDWGDNINEAQSC